MKGIIDLKLDDNISFKIINIKNIHSSGKYKDFRITIEAKFFNLKEYLKIDLTAGDVVIPKEIKYEYRLMFEDRTIDIMVYHLYTILAEKLETILSRNIANTRAKDFYDIYILTKLYGKGIDRINFLLEKTKQIYRSIKRALKTWVDIAKMDKLDNISNCKC